MKKLDVYINGENIGTVLGLIITSKKNGYEVTLKLVDRFNSGDTDLLVFPAEDYIKVKEKCECWITSKFFKKFLNHYINGADI